MTNTALNPVNESHLNRCVALAEAAAEEGDGAFGSVLVDSDGQVLAEDRNQETTSGDPTAHPEFTLAKWAIASLSPEARAASTVYTSGEHCPMCAAAHAWAGLGRIVYAASSAQLAQWRAEWGFPPAPVRPLAINEAAPGIPVVGPVHPFDDRIREVHARAVSRDPGLGELLFSAESIGSHLLKFV